MPAIIASAAVMTMKVSVSAGASPPMMEADMTATAEETATTNWREVPKDCVKDQAGRGGIKGSLGRYRRPTERKPSPPAPAKP